MKASHLLPVLVLAALLTPGLGRPTHANPPPARLQAPQLGAWIDVWVGMDNKDNYIQSIAYNSRHDEYMVLWNTAQDAYTADLWARRVGADGSLRSWFNVATSAGYGIGNARVAYSAAQDQDLMVFVSNYHSSTNLDIYARVVPGDGTAPSAPWIDIATGPDFQNDPAIAYNSQTDEFLVAWTNGHDVGGTNEEWAVQLQRLSASDGGLAGARRTVPGGGLGVSRSDPALAYDRARNQYMIAFIAGAPADVRSIVVPADLSWFESEFHVWDHTSQLQAFGPYSAAASDGYLVAWSVRHMSPPPTSYQLHNAYARHVSGSGVPLGATSGIAITAATPPFDMRQVSQVAFVPGYGYVVGLAYGQSWEWEWDAYAAFVPPGPDMATSPFAIDVAPTEAGDPGIACAPQGICLLAETYKLNTSWSKYDVRARFLYLQHLYLPTTLKDAG